MPAYRIREVDGDYEADTLASLHHRTFGPEVPHGDYGDGFWWLAYFEDAPIAFAGVCESAYDDNMGYFSRVGVLKQHRGNSLQQRLMRTLETKSRRVGWKRVVTDTTNTIHSSNNIIAAGYRLYSPRHPWAFPNTLYWKKDL